MNDEEDFDVSEVRELLAPVVADRGRSAAPTDAIVAAGRRRVVGRRVAVAGGTLAIVAAVPLAAAAIATGPGRTGTTAGAPASTGTPTRTALPTHSPTPSPKPAPLSAPSPAPTATDTRFPVAPNAPLPSTPLLLGSGVLEGRHWSVSGVASAGNSAPTAKSNCLKLLISEDGRTPDPALGVHILYCLPGVAEGYQVEDLPWEIKNGAGTLDVGTVSARVAKIVAHIDGVPAPVTVATVPAPGVPGTAIFIVPSSGKVAAHTVFDKYDSAGVKIGSWDNTKPLFTQ